MVQPLFGDLEFARGAPTLDTADLMERLQELAQTVGIGVAAPACLIPKTQRLDGVDEA
ncbi:hypothetical protein MPHL43072_13770 [Mycolicibacterium phlei DSM 43072]|nr:hypothetical protein MPHL43072_13770 [Mycolicibacterium phlei DSM 43072]